MSRSRRKSWVTDGYGTISKKRAKARHNHTIRRKLKVPNFEIPDGCGHKRGLGSDSWEICDYKFYIKKPPVKNEDYLYWKKITNK